MSKHAIILGGGYAGMLAAAVLSDHYDHVTLIERHHDFLDTSDPRKVRRGIPQGHHLHVLLKQGSLAFSEIFPGYQAYAAAACPQIDWARDTEWHGPFGRYPNYPSAVTTHLHSRAFLDQFMRQRIMQYPNVTVRFGVSELVLNQRAAPRVLIRNNLNDELSGDLIVDARGRTSTIMDELRSAHFSAPKQERVATNLSYTSQIFSLASGTQPFKQFYLQVRKDRRMRGAVVSPIEHNRLMVTHISLDSVARNPSITELSTQVCDSATRAALSAAQPQSAIHHFRNAESKHIHFSSIPSWPKGLLVMGDALAILNPAYGQGMTVAGMQARALQHWLASKQRRHAATHTLQKQFDQISYFPWQMTATEDRRGEHRLPITTRALQHYLDLILRGACVDQQLHKAFMHVVHLLAPSHTLFAPAMLMRAVRRGYFPRRLPLPHREPSSRKQKAA